MKKILLLVFLFPAIVTAQSGFTISGKVGLKNAAIAILTSKADGVSKADTAKIVNGTFTFSGAVPYPMGANIDVRYYAAPGFQSVADNFTLFLENRNMLLSSVDYIKNAVITGSPVNEQYSKMKASIANGKPANLREQSSLYSQYAANNTNSLIGLVALSLSLDRDADESIAQTVLYKFSPEMRSLPYAKSLQTTIDAFRNTKPGGTAMEFAQNDVNDKLIKLSDFHGKYVLIDFWASWCGPCRNENPNLVIAHNQFKNKNFTVIGVSLDRNKNNWLKAIKDDNLNWAQVSDLQYWENAVAKQYGVKGIPTNILVAPDGKIVGKNLFGEQLKRKLAELTGSN